MEIDNEIIVEGEKVDGEDKSNKFITTRIFLLKP